MSEKYSTDELINELEIILTEANAGEAFKFHKVNRAITDTIISKLRAADKLCEAAKEAWPEMSRHNWNNEYQQLYEAIAEYEGKA